MIKIGESEIRKRMQKLRNYEKILYPELKERSDKLRNKNKELEAENKRLKKENKQIEKLLLELEELKAMKFGKKRQSRKREVVSVPEEVKKKKKKRSKESYRRPKPSKDEITDKLKIEIEKCPECGEELVEKKEHVHYREDLKKVEELIKTAKQIVETTIESGRCETCGKRQFAMEVPKNEVILGENLRQMIVYLTVVQGQSYEEVLKGLRDQYGIKPGSGTIANILEGESILLTPYYNSLVLSLYDEGKTYGCHYDETSWKTWSNGKEVSEGNYCWTKVGVKSKNRIIWFGCSRGKGVAKKLRGEKEGSRGISDDYGAYKYMFDIHGLCWAHPYRKLRDLAESQHLTGKIKKVCQKAYKDFKKVYKRSKKFREKLLLGLDEKEKLKEYEELKILFAKIFKETDHDPEKLKTIRKTLNERKDRYFTFVDYPEIPLDNNKAERALRKVVLKRKKSFGCQSQKGANVLSILYSVVFSLVESNPDENFFKLYNQAANFEPEKI